MGLKRPLPSGRSWAYHSSLHGLLARTGLRVEGPDPFRDNTADLSEILKNSVGGGPHPAAHPRPPRVPVRAGLESQSKGASRAGRWVRSDLGCEWGMGPV